MAARLSHCRAPRPAFTLVELAIVVMIMGILASVAAPKYGAALAAHRATLAAERIAADLRMIRQYARRVSKPQQVQFDAANNSYTAPTMPDVNRPASPYVVNLATSDYAADITTASFGGAATVTFDIYGRPSAAGVVTLQTRNETREVQLNEAGDVQVETP